MKLTHFSETPNGSLTVFTLLEDTLDDALILVIHNTFTLQKVASAPAAGQFSKSGTAVTFGIAPATGSRLSAFIQATADTGLRIVPIAGIRNGVNTSFTLGMLPPAGSNAIVGHSGRIVEEVTSGPVLGQYTIAGQAVTWNTVYRPQSSQELFALVEVPLVATAAFTVLVLTPTANPLVFDTNLAASLEYSHELFLFVSGSMLVRAEAEPIPGYYRYDDTNQQVILGAGIGTGQIYGWTVNFIEREDENVALLALLQSRKRTHILLATLHTLNPAGAPALLRFATEEYSTQAADTPANTSFAGLIAGNTFLQITRSLQEAFLGHSTLALGQLTIYNHAGELESIFGVNGHSFGGRTLEVELVGRHEEGYAYADRGRLLLGVMDEPRREDHACSLPISDNLQVLTLSVPSAALMTDEYALLPEASIGRMKPIINGTVLHLEPILVNPSTQQYVIAGHAIAAILAVYDQGVATGLTVTPDLANGRFTLSGTPVGKVTCDVEGRKIAGVFSEGLFDIIEDKLLNDVGFGADELHEPSFLNAKAAWNFAVGLATTAPTELRDSIDALVSSVIGWHQVRPDGRLQVGQLAPPAAAPLLRLDASDFVADSFSLEIEPPISQIVFEYAPLETIFTDGDIADAVTGDTRHYLKTGQKTLVYPAVPDAAILAAYPLAQPKRIRTRLRNEADAQAMLAYAWQIFSLRQARVQADFRIPPMQLKLHDTVQFDGPYATDGNWRVTTIEETFAATRGEQPVRLTLWRPIT